jgi:hypothetical protein
LTCTKGSTRRRGSRARDTEAGAGHWPRAAWHRKALRATVGSR